MPRFERRGFRKFGPRLNIPKPVKVGEEYDVKINEVGSKGDGIARVKNFVVFVANTKKGENAHIKITEVRNRFAIGEKTEVSEKAVEEAPEEKEATEEAQEEATKETEEVSEEVEETPAEEVEKTEEEPTEKTEEESEEKE